MCFIHEMMLVLLFPVFLAWGILDGKRNSLSPATITALCAHTFTDPHIRTHAHRLAYTHLLSHHLFNSAFYLARQMFNIFLSLWQCNHFSQVIQVMYYQCFSFLCSFQCAYHCLSSNSLKLIKSPQDIQVSRSLSAPSLWWQLSLWSVVTAALGFRFNTLWETHPLLYVQAIFPHPTSSSFWLTALF